jgi:hypothetical protein
VEPNAPISVWTIDRLCAGDPPESPQAGLYGWNAPEKTNLSGKLKIGRIEQVIVDIDQPLLTNLDL